VFADACTARDSGGRRLRHVLLRFVDFFIALRKRCEVLVRDQFDNPVQGHAVTFAVQTGGGTVSPLTAVATLANGTATVTSWTLGIGAGTDSNSLW
jgi:hypothetical protein